MLYAFVVQEKIPGEAVLDVYSLVYPPLSSDEIYMEKEQRLSFFYMGYLWKHFNMSGILLLRYCICLQEK